MINSDIIDPPKWAVSFLQWFCPTYLLEGILGDLIERFDGDVVKLGITYANRQFVWSVIRFFHPMILFRNRKVKNYNYMGMFKNHITVAARSMQKYKFYAFVNILGLTLAIAFVSLSYLFIQNELSFDKFHENGERIYRLYSYELDPETGDEIDGAVSGVTPIPLARDLKSSMPGIVNYARYGSSNGTVKVDNVLFDETICMVDPAFLEIFSFPMTLGDENALKDPNAIVLSKDRAEKYFNDVNPLGRELVLILNDSSKTFIVTGVVDNKESVSSIKFDLLIPFERMEMLVDKTYLETYRVAFIESWVAFDKPIQNSITETLSAVIAKDTESDHKKWMVDAQPLNEVHFDISKGGLATFTNPQKLWILSALAVLVLIIAIINFITLSTGHSMHRIKEIGLRKSLGASRFMLRVQLIFESFVITLLAASVGSVITYFILPAFNELIDGSIVWQITLLNFGFILLLSFLISLISGTVQAGILVSVTPLSALKGTTAFSSKESWLNQGLIILQFTLSALLITGTLIMRDQMNFIQQKDLGFDKDRLIEISLHTSGDLDATKQLIDRYKTTVQLNPLIKNMAGTMNSFLEPWTQLSFRQIDGSSEDIFFNQIDVDYLNTMNIKLVSGKNFNEVGGSNVTDIIVNEALVKHFEWDSPYDKQIPGRNFDKNHRIVGVIEDFHFSSLHNKIAPIILAIDQGSIASGVTGLNTYVWPPNLYRTVVRVGQGELSEAVSFLEESWKQVNPGKPFTYDFVDDVLANNYSEEARWNKVINYASIFAIVIAWMGLLGLTRLSVQKRTKEIGIRKVLGSSALKVTTALSMRFLFLVVIATAISWPIAWLAMGKWLESFSYRVDLSAMTFIVASAGILIISLFSVGMQAYRAAIANPVESLKYE